MTYSCDWTKSPGLAYSLKPGILFPGTAAQANALERKAEDQLEDALGLGASVLANTLVITPG
jgi:hypothetical protein